jgi:hypothetical protein
VLVARGHLGMLPRLVAHRPAAICKAFLRRSVGCYKYRVATDTNSWILQVPNAVTGETGAILPIYIRHGDARSDICRRSSYLI